MDKTGEHITNVFLWAWQAGLDVSLYSRRYDVPVKTGDFNMPRVKADFPVLRFSYNGKSIEIVAQDWNDMVDQLKFRVKSIHADLMCPEFRKIV